MSKITPCFDKDTDLELLIDALKLWPDNWDGHGSSKANLKSIEIAKNVAKNAYLIAFGSMDEWKNPLVSLDEKGDVVLEWFYNNRIVIIDISEEGVLFTDVDTTEEINIKSFFKPIEDF